MNKKTFDKIINFFREEMMTTQSSSGKPGFSELSPKEGPTSGFSPKMGLTKRIYLGSNSRSRWMRKKSTT